MFQPEKWISPASVKQAVKFLGDHGKSALAYGGGTYIYEMAKRGQLDRVGVVVDLRGLKLAYVRNSRGKIRIGASTTMTALEESNALNGPGLRALKRAAVMMGPRQVKNLATVGGALSCGQPMVDIGVPLLAMGTMVTIMGRSGAKRVDLWKVSGKSAASRLATGDLVVELEVDGSGQNLVSCYKKLSRGAAHWPVAGVAIIVEKGPDGLCRRVGIATGGISYGYSRHDEIGRQWVGKPLDRRAAEMISAAVSEEVRPQESLVLGSADYQRDMLKALTWEAVQEISLGEHGGM